MKNLVKLVVLVIILITTTSCNNKKIEKKKTDKNKKFEEVNKQKEKEAFLYNSNTLTNNKEIFFSSFFKGKNISIFEGLNSYYIVKAGSHIDYDRNNKNYSGVLISDIIAMNVNGEFIINEGHINDIGELNIERHDFELHIFPKILLTGIAMKFANKYEGSYFPMFEDGPSKSLENLYFSVNSKDEYGYRIDYTKVCDKGFGLEFVGYNILEFNEDSNLKQTRKSAMQSRGETYVASVVDNFVLLSRCEK